MKKIFNNLDELESFFIKEKNFILNLMFYKIEEAVENQDEEVYILDAFVKDIYLHMKLNTHKKDLGPTLDKLEEYFADLEDYEKCAKIVEYKKLLSLGML
jgi:hypothetical protein|tara:strand:- start:6722 stop:7021 length:300 start_codon:yes stop_codon:yes gene_type:complete